MLGRTTLLCKTPHPERSRRELGVVDKEGRDYWIQSICDKDRTFEPERPELLAGLVTNGLLS